MSRYISSSPSSLPSDYGLISWYNSSNRGRRASVGERERPGVGVRPQTEAPDKTQLFRLRLLSLIISVSETHHGNLSAFYPLTCIHIHLRTKKTAIEATSRSQRTTYRR
ncbi:hypothetical protein M422DRAFT_244982 [Sphaerobolus stellatus SS14]|nr:hypothetical protein M422DRAFT_244982 [Sphaerobolus stellatus SS14]